MKNSTRILFLSLFLLLSACTATPPATPASSNEQMAETALASYLAALNNAQYAEAAKLYTGSYEVLQGYNPGIDANDYASLLQSGCTINGFQCLEVKSITLKQKASDTKYIFAVEFLNADGSLFVRGPCCGGDETDSPSQSVFEFSVVKMDNGGFGVMDLPPYTP